MKLLLFVCFLSAVIQANAQNTTYLKDLYLLRGQLAKTPSYKDQIKAQKAVAYQALVDSLSKLTTEDPTSFEYFANLSQLLFPVNDNHLILSQTIKTTQTGNQQMIQFRKVPQYNYNTDSLRKVLSSKPDTSVEGIYYYENKFEVGLFQIKPYEYLGVVLSSNFAAMQTAQFAFYLYEKAPLQFHGIYLHPYSGQYILQLTEKYRNLSLVNSYKQFLDFTNTYKKDTLKPDYVNLPSNAPLFKYEKINDSVDYVVLRTFQRNNANTKESFAFYNQLRESVKGAYLILDLRNHYGGSKLEMKKFYKLMQQYTKKNKLYVLVNNRTLSQAEIFTYMLQQLKNTTTAGQTTKGMITYGSNYGKSNTLPSGEIIFNPTDMYGQFKLLNYENTGIEPQIILTTNQNWIQQVLDLIK
ncbi:S41 family peptidase [Gynurincola endophyticus]|uniref:S41 family peptidase n=1 Tax=Gynurincola endophyticus TaxID=2479004 RepID=UPI000F8CC3F8|nr:S41 family peptidase [Gynurincola endophyticus]